MIDLEFMENSSPSPADPVPGKRLWVCMPGQKMLPELLRAATPPTTTTTTTSPTSQAAMFRSVTSPPDQGCKVKGRLCPGSVAQKVPPLASKVTEQILRSGCHGKKPLPLSPPPAVTF